MPSKHHTSSQMFRFPASSPIFKGTSQMSLRRVDTMVMARKDPKEAGWC